jgi:hypothetical protein
MNIKSVVGEISLVEETETVSVQDIERVVNALSDLMAQEGKIADVIIAHGLKRTKRIKCRKKKQ